MPPKKKPAKEFRFKVSGFVTFRAEAVVTAPSIDEAMVAFERLPDEQRTVRPTRYEVEADEAECLDSLTEEERKTI